MFENYVGQNVMTRDDCIQGLTRACANFVNCEALVWRQFHQITYFTEKEYQMVAMLINLVIH